MTKRRILRLDNAAGWCGIGGSVGVAWEYWRVLATRLAGLLGAIDGSGGIVGGGICGNARRDWRADLAA